MTAEERIEQLTVHFGKGLDLPREATRKLLAVGAAAASQKRPPATLKEALRELTR